MPNEFWNIIGVLTIVAAFAASHPMGRAATSRFEAQFAEGWQEMVELPCQGVEPAGCTALALAP